jgi:hypothetical protein
MKLARVRRRSRGGASSIATLEDDTALDARTGAVRSVQRAEVLLPENALEEVWSPEYLERLARTYWRFLARITAGIVHVHYGESKRYVVLLLPAVRLITFAAPEYEMAPDRGLVRWRIERGLLVARGGAAADSAGHLQIEVRREPPAAPGWARVHVVVEVANFHPAIASALGRRLYEATQARFHVLVTRAFLRSLVRGASAAGVPDLAHSRVGRLAEQELEGGAPGARAAQ